jgi:hypothetical protein
VLPRGLTTAEQSLLQRFAALLQSSDADALSRQIKLALVAREEVGHVVYTLPADAPGLRQEENTDLTAYCDDDDGAEIVIIIHFVWPAGTLCSKEQFRSDGRDIKKKQLMARDLYFAQRRS